jgi:hypothetical protein
MCITAQPCVQPTLAIRHVRIGSWLHREELPSDIAVEEIARLVGHASSKVSETIYRHQLRPVLTTSALGMPGPCAGGCLTSEHPASRSGYYSAQIADCGCKPPQRERRRQRAEHPVRRGAPLDR